MWDGGQKCEPTFSKLLSLEQRRELKDLLEVHYSTLINKPGYTTLVEHRIQTGDSNPIRLTPYRLPHVYRETVRTELEEIADSGHH